VAVSGDGDVRGLTISKKQAKETFKLEESKESVAQDTQIKLNKSKLEILKQIEQLKEYIKKEEQEVKDLKKEA